MAALVPHRFLFRYCFPVQYVGGVPRKGRKLLSLPPECALPDFAEMEQATSFGELRLGWNEEGLAVSVRVAGKQQSVACNAETPHDSDALQVWIDTRCTQTVHRAGRFCHHFCLLPGGAGAKGTDPIALAQPIARARQQAPIADPESLPIRAELLKDGYRLEAWLPAEALHGFDPQANPRLGFYYCLKDIELGEQYLSVDRDFPFDYDPSLWATLELVSE